MPGASSSLLSNKYFDKLYVNRLKAIDLKSDNLNDDDDKNEISYLFSIISKNAEITNNGDHLLFKIKRSDSNIIQFSDRPKRIVDSNFSLDEFAAIFVLDKNSSNSFVNDPPNVVLSTGEKQQVYELFYETHNSYEDDTIDSDLTFKLVPLENENIIYETGTLQNISLFVDSISVGTTYTIILNTDSLFTLHNSDTTITIRQTSSNDGSSNVGFSYTTSGVTITFNSVNSLIINQNSATFYTTSATNISINSNTIIKNNDNYTVINSVKNGNTYTYTLKNSNNNQQFQFQGDDENDNTVFYLQGLKFELSENTLKLNTDLYTV